MGNADTDALTERMAEEMYYSEYPETRHRNEWPDAVFPDAVYEYRDLAAAVLPIVAEEVRKAKAEALREAANHIEEVVANARPEQAFTEHVLMEHGGPGYLRELATEYETGDSDEHR